MMRTSPPAPLHTRGEQVEPAAYLFAASQIFLQKHGRSASPDAEPSPLLWRGAGGEAAKAKNQPAKHQFPIHSSTQPLIHSSLKLISGLQFLLLLLLLPCTVDAQTASREYPFIRHEKNVILNNENLDNFYAALQSLQTRKRHKVKVLHLGDSHIQADVFSGQLRSHLQHDSLFGNGGRGFVFPYPVAKTNNPYNYKVTYSGTWSNKKNISRGKTSDWGLSGITVTTEDTLASITINSSRIPGKVYPVQWVRVFYSASDSSYQPVLLTGFHRSTRLFPVSPGQPGIAEFVLPETTDEITLSFSKTDSLQNSFTLQGVVLENSDTGLVYHHSGVNGADATAWLRSPKLAEQVALLRPDLIVISLGTNDAFSPKFNADSFRVATELLLIRLQQAAPNASFLLTTPGDCYQGKYINTKIPQAGEAIKALATGQKAAAWDLYELMGGLRSINKWKLAGLAAKDRVHYSNKGYSLQGDLLFDALMAGYKDWMEQNLKSQAGQ